MIVCYGFYFIGENALKKLFVVTIPESLKDLQGLFGQLNFASCLIPGYKRVVRPIEKFLQTDMALCWT